MLAEAIRELGSEPRAGSTSAAPVPDMGVLCAGPQCSIIKTDVLFSLIDSEMIEIEMPP